MPAANKYNKFWFIYSASDVEFLPDKFMNLSEAVAEARNLAINNPNCEFFVLESVGVATVSESNYFKI